jgi:hypothetical protein
VLDGPVSIPGSASSLPHSDPTGSGAHPFSYPMGTEGSFPGGVKRQGHETDHSSSSNAEVKNDGPTPPLLHMSSWRSA